MNQMPHSQAVTGTLVTVYYANQGVGVGYLQEDGRVFRTTGIYWAVKVQFDADPADDVDAADYFVDDAGAGYRCALHGQPAVDSPREVGK